MRTLILTLAMMLVAAIGVLMYGRIGDHVDIAEYSYPPLKLAFSGNPRSVIAVNFSRSDEHLWTVHGGRLLHGVSYGVVPDGCEQTFPEDGNMPKPIKNGDKVRVFMSYTYVGFMSPYFGQRGWRFEIHKGKAKRME